MVPRASLAANRARLLGRDVDNSGVAVTLHLIDAAPYIFRAYFTLPEMEDDRGRPVSAVYGFAGFLLRYVSEHAPTHAALAFDESLTTSFRNDFYPEYKAQREQPPEELVEQLDTCKRVAEAFGIRVFAHDRYEADDLIASMVRHLAGQCERTVIVSPDKDLAQLVDDSVELFDFARDRRWGPAEVLEKFGVRCEQIADYLGLAGDSVDNIPGVPRVGAKTAAALLGHYANLEALYDDLDGVAELPFRGARSCAKNLAEHRDLAFLSRRLATLAYDVEVPRRLEELALGTPDAGELDTLFARLGFATLRERAAKVLAGEPGR